jgi:glycogen debranching enzyme
MLPQDCTLALTGGTQVVVGREGSVTAANGYTGVYANDHRYLDTLATTITDGETTPSWEVLGRHSDGSTVTTLLTSSADGPGRGAVRAWTLRKRVHVDPGQVTLTLSLTNNTNDERTADITTRVVPDFGHVFEVESFFNPRDAPERPATVETSDRDLQFTATVADGSTQTVTVDSIDGDANVATEQPSGAVTWRRTVAPGDSADVELSLTLPNAQADVPQLEPTGVAEEYESLAEAARASLDALMMPAGVPAAGAPRFVAPFGRDSLVVAYQLLEHDPNVAVRTLRYLAAEQGTETNPETREAPGRILHEHRTGDLVEIGESIRQPYYGTIDATPLFVALYADTVARTESDTLRSELYDAAVSGVEWVLSNADDRGFLTYESHDHQYGLHHLGWKDSADALAHPDGTPASGSVVLPEVQGYVYRALTAFAPLARAAGDDGLADSCQAHAETLFEAFEAAFWLPEESCYALGIDDNGIIPSVASNQTHAIWGGLGTAEHVAQAVERLTRPDMLTESGLRTFAGSHAAFDPLSYHRGSVWPHDNSFAAMGFVERGFDDAAATLAERGLRVLEDCHRRAAPDRLGFPELFTGLDEAAVSNGYLVHPDSCEPAAWSAGSVYGFLRAHPAHDNRPDNP